MLIFLLFRFCFLFLFLFLFLFFSKSKNPKTLPNVRTHYARTSIESSVFCAIFSLFFHPPNPLHHNPLRPSPKKSPKKSQRNRPKRPQNPSTQTTQTPQKIRKR